MLWYDGGDLGGKLHFFSIAAGLFMLYARRKVISCVTKASAWHYTLHDNHWHRLKDSRCQKQRYNCQSISQILYEYFHTDRIVLLHVNTLILKVWRSVSRA